MNLDFVCRTVLPAGLAPYGQPGCGSRSEGKATMRMVATANLTPGISACRTQRAGARFMNAVRFGMLCERGDIRRPRVPAAHREVRSPATIDRVHVGTGTYTTPACLYPIASCTRNGRLRGTRRTSGACFRCFQLHVHNTCQLYYLESGIARLIR
jgi:hypothetical protein